MMRPIDLVILQTRAEARARLAQDGEYETIDEAVAPLMQFAFKAGIVGALGSDAVLTIIATAFNARGIDMLKQIQNEDEQDEQ